MSANKIDEFVQALAEMARERPLEPRTMTEIAVMRDQMESRRCKVLKTRVKAQVRFVYFTDGALWYEAVDGWKFPVPVSDAGTGSFHAEEKGILLMRWMRRHMEEQATWKPE